MNLSDQSQREYALNPTRSFIVQAPAGSGKTELLTKRFLRLLGGVEHPEEILAITFTRKAAYEMRRRIIESIQKAKELCQSSEQHTRRIGELALSALQQDAKYGWHLVENPNRLRIQTIDAFCMSLVKQMPILSHFGRVPHIESDARKLYKEAVDELIQYIDDDQVSFSKALKQLLFHMDNRLSALEKLLIDMLSKRDQWLPYVLNKKVRHELENGLKIITIDCLEKLKKSFPKESVDEFSTLIQFSSIGDATFSRVLTNDLSIEEQRKQWLKFCDLLLNQNRQFRSVVNKNHGFPSVSAAENGEQKELYRQMKQRMEALLKAFSQYPDLHEALLELRYAPEMVYTDQQWQALMALLELLPVAAAQLKLVFNKYSKADFIEVASAARVALGTSENPTDLALSLDYKIHHLLIDEFQDTSIAQFRLFEQLVSQWQPDEGRTVFIVGDAMQSIYRFRNAEVGLFLRTWKEGIGNIRLTPLTLSVNFRSNKPIVDWCNQTFSQIFPVYEDMSVGAVSYCAAESYDEELNVENTPVIHILKGESFDEEAKKIVIVIQNLRHNHPNESIAILVKARLHLEKILPILRHYHVPYQAVEIDRLSERMVVRDLLALTKALLHLADRIAWLSILRAPWCGLSLKDLHTIASEKCDQTIWQRLHEPSVLKNLTPEGLNQVEKLKDVINPALKERGRTDLRTWISKVWLNLEAPAYLENHFDLENAQAYFDLLDELSVGCDIKSFSELEEKAYELFSSVNQFDQPAVQVMTIHKAKGLEFDTVILPGLERISPRQEQQLLFWMERPRVDGSDLILAPIKKRDDRNDTICRYLSYQDKQKDRFENIRLLYVAATRARKKLYLLGTLYQTENSDNPCPPKDSFLYLLRCQTPS